MTDRQKHSDWLHTFRTLEAYTNGFTEPLQGKPDDWFLAGPLFLPGLIKNAAWARGLVPRKFQSRVVPGIEYAKAFLHYQTQATARMRLNHEPFREQLARYEQLKK